MDFGYIYLQHTVFLLVALLARTFVASIGGWVWASSCVGVHVWRVCCVGMTLWVCISITCFFLYCVMLMHVFGPNVVLLCCIQTANQNKVATKPCQTNYVESLESCIAVIGIELKINSHYSLDNWIYISSLAGNHRT